MRILLLNWVRDAHYGPVVQTTPLHSIPRSNDDVNISLSLGLVDGTESPPTNVLLHVEAMPIFPFHPEYRLRWYIYGI